MANINDAEFSALGSQGFTGNINERELAWFQANGATSGNIMDARRQALIDQGFSGNVNDGFFALLGSLGYEGALSDRLLAFWRDGGSITPPSTLVDALIFTTSTDIEEWDMEVSPFVPSSLITDYPEATALGVDYNGVINRLAIAGNDLHIYRTDIVPFALVQTIPLAGSGFGFVRYSVDGSRLFVGSSLPGENYIFDTANMTPVLLNSDPINGAALNGDGTRLVVTRLGSVGGFRCLVFDTTSLPPVLLASPAYTNAGEWGRVDIHPVHNILVIAFTSGADSYAHNLNTNAFISVFDTSPGRAYRFSRDGSRLAMLTSAGLIIRNTTSATVASWSTLSLAGGAGVTGTDTGGLSYSFDNRFLSVYQPSTAGSRRLVMDLSTSPIQRVASFDTAGAASFQGAAITGFNAAEPALARFTEGDEERFTEENEERESE